jgi:hypothetical protein
MLFEIAPIASNQPFIWVVAQFKSAVRIGENEHWVGVGAWIID